MRRRRWSSGMKALSQMQPSHPISLVPSLDCGMGCGGRPLGHRRVTDLLLPPAVCEIRSGNFNGSLDADRRCNSWLIINSQRTACFSSSLMTLKTPPSPLLPLPILPPIPPLLHPFSFHSDYLAKKMYYHTMHPTHITYNYHNVAAVYPNINICLLFVLLIAHLAMKPIALNSCLNWSLNYLNDDILRLRELNRPAIRATPRTRFYQLKWPMLRLCKASNEINAFEKQSQVEHIRLEEPFKVYIRKRKAWEKARS